MSDEKIMQSARQVYKTLCDAIDHREWTYEKEEDKLLVHFSVGGDDIPMKFILVIDPERQLVRLLSPLPYKMSEEKRVDGAVITCAASYGMIDGSFDYDIAKGSICFRLTESYRESLIGEDVFQYMISLSCAMVDKYNDLFLAVDKGIMSASDFVAKEFKN